VGGLGSGGSRYGGRATIEGSCVLRLSWLRRNGALNPSGIKTGFSSWSSRGETVASIGWTADMRDSPSLTLFYSYTSHGRSAEQVEDRFALIQTKPHFGGARWWILCRCGRRAAQLCKPPGANRFRCRLCYGLAYQSQSETSEWRAYRRVRKVGERLSPGWTKELVPADLWDYVHIPPKPKWMRWRTYEECAARYRTSASFYQRGAMATMNRLVGMADRQSTKKR
jgi:hypothetical protein